MRRAAVVLVIVCSVFLTGCATIQLLSSPDFVSIGDIATFVVGVSAVSGASDAIVHVAAEVPIGWSLDSATYTATVDGVQISGAGAVVPPGSAYCAPDPRPGYQMMWIADGPIDISGGDFAEVTLDFAVNELPVGEIEARFWVYVDSTTGSTCGPYPAVATMNLSPRRLAFRESVDQGALTENRSLAISPDRSKLLVGGYKAYTEAALFDRNPVTGNLTWIESFDKATIHNLHDVVFSPDGRHVYGVDEGADQLIAFEFGPSPVALRPIQALNHSTLGFNLLAGDHVFLTISPDGGSVYATDSLFNLVYHFSRDLVSGELTFVESHYNFSAGQDEPRSPELSPDGANLYLVGLADDAVLVYDRDPATGQLAFLESHIDGIDGVTGLVKPRSLAISPDGWNVYAVAESSIAIFDRDPASGSLAFVEALFELGAGGIGLNRPNDISVTPDNRTVLVASNDSLSVYTRAPASGLLTLKETTFGNNAGVPDLSYPNDLLIAPNNADVFIGCDNAVQVFSWRLLCDGFESGDVSAWSALSP